MSTSSSPCGCKQVLVDAAKTIFDICDNAGNPAFVERGEKGLTQGAVMVTVPWATEKASVNYSFTELDVENLQDANPINIDAEIVSRTTASFKVQLSAAPDSANYILRFNAYVTKL